MTKEGPFGDVECRGCNKVHKVAEAFRCFYCLSWFCEDCAVNHFGETRAEYWAKKAAMSGGSLFAVGDNAFARHGSASEEKSRLRGSYGWVRVMKSENFGYELQVRCLGKENVWVSINCFDYLANARAIARQIRDAGTLTGRSHAAPNTL